MLAALLVTIGAGYAYIARSIPLDAYLAAEPINSRTLPTLYAVVLISLALVLAAMRPTAGQPVAFARPVALIGCMIAFAWLVPFLSLWLAVPVLLIPAFRVMGETRWPWIVGVALATAACGWVVTELLLGLTLPRGSWMQ